MSSTDYTLDKSTGLVTMADGATFNPYTGEGCENLTPEQLKAYRQERPTGLSELTENERLVREYALLEAEVDPMQARMDEIKKYLRASLDQGSHEISGSKVTISKNSRLDAKKAAEMYPQESYPDFYKTSLDSAAVKRAVAPAVYEAMSTEGEPRVTIK